MLFPRAYIAGNLKNSDGKVKAGVDSSQRIVSINKRI